MKSLGSIVVNKQFSARQGGLIILIAFVVNSAWEYLHYNLYIPVHPIASGWYVLILAAALDTLYLLILFSLFYRFGILWVFLSALLLAFGIEQWALYFRIWEYTDSMPVVPVFKVGFSPLVQLAVSVLIIWFLVSRNGIHQKS